MPFKVTFPNLKKSVVFQNRPTQQDIEEAEKQIMKSSNDYLIKKISLQDYSEVYSAIITPALNNDYLTNRTNVYLKNNGEAYYISSSNMIFKLNILSNNNQISQIELQDHIGGFFTVLNDI